MQLVIKGKNLEVTDWLRNYVEKKMGKLDRYLPTIDEVRIELSVQKTKSAKDRQVAQVTVRSNGAILRAEERTDDMFASIDAVLDKIYRQIARFKGKRIDRYRGQAEPLPEEEEMLPEAEERSIVRTKNFRISPMDEEEAIEQMELLGHDFFVFYNVANQNINVLYRRKDGNYGLLNPQME
jgi:putative sigma-54 modulation protein